MKRSMLILLSLFLVFACKRQDAGLQSEIEIPVSLQDLKLRSIEEFISTSGTVYPTREASLKSEMSGYYHLQVNPRTGKEYMLGDRVQKGDTLIKFENEVYRNGIQLEGKKLNREISKNELEKQESLYEKGGVTERELKNAGVSYVNADYALKDAYYQMEKMAVTAPISGVVVTLPYHTENTWVETGSPMVTLMEYSRLYMDISLPEKFLNKVNLQQEVRLTNYTLPDDTLIGVIRQISPAVNAQTRTFQSVISINNSDLLMRPGMFVKADIVTNRADSTIVIPKEVILSKQRGRTIFIVDNGIARERRIQTGLENNEMIEVVRGLRPNDRLVIEGFETLNDRSKVKIIK